MAQTLNLHALVILMALTAGTVLAGVFVVVLAVPCVAVSWRVLKVWTGRDEPRQTDPVDEAQEQIEAASQQRAKFLKEQKQQRKADKKAQKTEQQQASQGFTEK